MSSTPTVSTSREEALEARVRQLEQLERLNRRIAPVTAGVKELTRAAAEALGELEAVAVVLLRPSREEIWVACAPEVDREQLTPQVEAALTPLALVDLDRARLHRVDASLQDCRAVTDLGAECSRAGDSDDRLVLLRETGEALTDPARDFLERVAGRTLRTLTEREMVNRILEHARFLERRLDQVVASYRIARSLVAPVEDDQAAGRILWDVRQSFHADAAVLIMEAPDDGRLLAISAIEGGERQERAFLSWAADEYRRRFDAEVPAELEVRRTHAVHAKLSAPRRESLEEPGDQSQWWPSQVVAPFSMGRAPGLLCLGSRRPDEFGAEAETALRILAGDTAQTLGHLYGAALRERRQFEQLVAHIPAAILLVSPTGELQVTNVATAQLLGWGDDRPQTLSEVAAQTGLQLELLVQEVRTNQSDVLGREIVWGDDQARYLRADANRILDGDGHETGVVLALRDVTQLKRLELEQAEFVGTVSHELRTPLTSMNTALELVLAGETGPVNEEQAHFLEMTRRNIDRLGRLIQQLLDVARQGAGRLRLDRQSTDLSTLLQPSLEGFQRTAEAEQRTLTWDLVPAEAFVDRDRFLEILENLVGNGLKFTEPGGHVHVVVSDHVDCPSADAQRLAQALGIELRGVRLAVRDDGPGMAEETKEHVFERFYQAGDPLADRPNGAGLGLAITQALVGGHDGMVTVESELGKGTEIQVWIPTDASSGSVMYTVQLLQRELTRLQQRLHAGCLLAVPSGIDDPELSEILSEAGVTSDRLCIVQASVGFLLLSEPEWQGVLLRRLEAWAGRGEHPLGMVSFPDEATDLGTLLALSLERGRGALEASSSRPPE